MISEVRLRNFKCFESLDLPLGPLTLLSGTNSAGKSTVIQSLLLLRQSALHGELRKDGRAVLNGELVQLGDADATVREGSEERKVEIGITWDDGCFAAWRFRPEEEDLRVEQSPADGFWESRPPVKDCRYVSADRMGPRVTFRTSDVLVRTARDVGARGELVAHYLAEYGDKHIPNLKLHFDGKSMGIDAPPAVSTKLRQEVEAWLGLLVPGVRITVEKPAGLDVVRLAFRFPGAYGLTDERRPTHVGFGLSYVLPLFVAVLSAEPGSLVMIENPEAHLHPRAQRLLVELLSRAAATGVQLIVETHSDHVLNGARLAVRNKVLRSRDVFVHFLTYDPVTGKPDVLTPQIKESGGLTDWPIGFFDEWERALDELTT